MIINNYDAPYDVYARRSMYYDGNLAIVLFCNNGECYGNLTVNLGERLPSDMAYVDTNNMPDAIRFIEENKMGTFTGKKSRSGFCEYPLYRFDLNFFDESNWKSMKIIGDKFIKG